MKAFRAKISFVLVLAFLTSVCRSILCQGGTFELTRSENIRFNIADAGYRVNRLDPVAVLPAGTVIEVDDSSIHHPVMTRYTCNPQTERGCDPSVPEYASHGFVGNVRILSIPTSSGAGRLALARIRRFFHAGGDRVSLYFSRATLFQGTRLVYAKDGRRGLRLSRPQQVYGGPGYRDDPDRESALYQAAEQAGRLAGALPRAPQRRCDSAGQAWRRWLAEYPRRLDVRAMLGALWRNHQPRFTYYCYRYVKRALYESGMVPWGALNTRWDENASSAVTRLQRFGFRNLLNDPRFQYLRQDPDRAPVGAVVVYAGDHSGPEYVPGDVQIRTSRGWIADYFSQHSLIHQWNGRHFRVIGVLVKSASEN